VTDSSESTAISPALEIEGSSSTDCLENSGELPSILPTVNSITSELGPSQIASIISSESMGSSFGMTSTASPSGGILPTLSSSGITDSESTVSSASAMSGQTPGSSGTGIDDENYSIKSYEGLALSLSSFLLASLCTLGNLY